VLLPPPEEVTMRYDREGFPIPPEFELPDATAAAEALPVSDSGTVQPRRRTGRAGWRKRLVVLAVLLGVVVPGLLGPQLLPTISAAVVNWSLEQAYACQATDDVAGAVNHLSRAISCHGDHPDLLCMRALARLESRDPQGALKDARQAAVLAPLASQPLRIQAVVLVVLGEADDAVAAADRAAELAGADAAAAVNHRAYIRGLVARDLDAALASIEQVVSSDDDAPPAFVDTHGFLLHLVGRHQEAIDQLNHAIAGMREERQAFARRFGRSPSTAATVRLREIDQALAVMYHHRSLACGAIGLSGQAEQDQQLAREKGFDPSRGIL
jgi:tetratricopeptide (TPR) repeat protein